MITTAEPAAIASAADLLKAGGIVAFPTETVYGLGADARSDAAAARIFAAKQRPAFNPLIAHIADVATAGALAVLDDRAEALAARFWPGALTMVLPQRPESGLSKLACAGLDTVALRCPAHPVARTLLDQTGFPIVAPSANRSGWISPTQAAHVAADLAGAVDMILDAGPCAIGVESTIVDLTDATARILRPGGIADRAIAAVIGEIKRGGAPDIRAPGQLERHYAPRLPLRMNVVAPRSDEVLLAFGADVPPGAPAVMNLSTAGDLEQAAANLFALLHAADQSDQAGIAVMPIPETGLGVAINDRLRRAAPGRG